MTTKTEIQGHHGRVIKVTRWGTSGYAEVGVSRRGSGQRADAVLRLDPDELEELAFTLLSTAREICADLKTLAPAPKSRSARGADAVRSNTRTRSYTG